MPAEKKYQLGEELSIHSITRLAIAIIGLACLVGVILADQISTVWIWAGLTICWMLADSSIKKKENAISNCGTKQRAVAYWQPVLAEWRYLTRKDISTEQDKISSFEDWNKLWEAEGRLPFWADVFEIELACVGLLNLSDLEAKASVLSVKIDISKIPQPKCSDPKDGNAIKVYTETLRSWVIMIIKEQQWSFSKSLQQESNFRFLRQNIKHGYRRIVIPAIGITFSLLLSDFSGSMGLATLTWTAVAGVSGAYASTLLRFSRTPENSSDESKKSASISDIISIGTGGEGVTQAMVVGMLFSIIGYFILVSGMQDSILSTQLETHLFPQFTTDFTCKLSRLDWLAVPNMIEDLAKLTVWAFVFGYAERLAPDVLNKLSGKFDNSKL
ncbi:hypothetical protein [Chitinibacter sp. S2-10]|uniref:hypothetical protein n=1 Tax=Chitinibacter sp. S2-10 TaxID=3373597 RepID=UPI0039772DF0